MTPEPNIEREADPEPQEHDFVEALIEVKKNPVERIEFSLNEVDMGLISLILRGKDVDSYAQ
ncbi:MAG: hypothetical protein OSB68_03305 [Dehalococcoidia bacterium]|nr:hypothetical protein [Dehalococcoidia bacterium]